MIFTALSWTGFLIWSLHLRLIYHVPSVFWVVFLLISVLNSIPGCGSSHLTELESLSSSLAKLLMLLTKERLVSVLPQILMVSS